MIAWDDGIGLIIMRVDYNLFNEYLESEIERAGQEFREGADSVFVLDKEIKKEEIVTR